MIRYTLSVTSVFLLVVGCASSQQAWEEKSSPKVSSWGIQVDASPLLAEADLHWKDRQNENSLSLAIASYEKAHDANPQNLAILTKLSEAYYLLGSYYVYGGQKDQALDIFKKAVLAGEKGLMLSTEFAAARSDGQHFADAVVTLGKEYSAVLYWYAANLGESASLEGFTSVLYYKYRIYHVVMQVQALNPNYFYSAPLRYMGIFHAKAARFSGGDINKSKSEFEKAIQNAPDYFGNKVAFAEFYAALVGDRDLFTKLLQSVLDGDPSIIPGIEAEQIFEQNRARRLLSRIDEVVHN